MGPPRATGDGGSGGAKPPGLDGSEGARGAPAGAEWGMGPRERPAMGGPAGRSPPV